MTFFRIKKIKGKEYAYIVENKWKRTAKSVHALRGVKPIGSRQKVKGYIGRAYRFDLNSDVDFLKFAESQNTDEYLNKRDIKKIINDLIEWEFFKFNIDERQFCIEINDKKVQRNKKDIALLINDGFMCSLTLKNLLEFKIENDEENDGYRLARAFVEAGIKVPQDIFIGLFSKLYKTQQLV